MLGRSLALSYIHGVRINNEALPFHCGLPRSRPSLPRFPPDRKWQHCLTAPCPFPLPRVLACVRGLLYPPFTHTCHWRCGVATGYVLRPAAKRRGNHGGVSSSSAKAMFSLMMQISDKQKQRYHGFRRVCQVSLLSTRSCLLSSLIRQRPQSLGFLSPSEGRHMASSRGGGGYFFLNKPSRSEGRYRVGGGPIMTKLPSPSFLSLVSVCERGRGYM